MMITNKTAYIELAAIFGFEEAHVQLAGRHLREYSTRVGVEMWPVVTSGRGFKNEISPSHVAYLTLGLAAVTAAQHAGSAAWAYSNLTHDGMRFGDYLEFAILHRAPISFEVNQCAPFIVVFDVGGGNIATFQAHSGEETRHWEDLTRKREHFGPLNVKRSTTVYSPIVRHLSGLFAGQAERAA